MAGRFEGLSDLEWKLFEDIFPEAPKKREVRSFLAPREADLFEIARNASCSIPLCFE